MKIFLSALENGSTVYDTGLPLAKYFVENGLKMKWNLMSYYYLRSQKQYDVACFIRDHSELVMIDSGAHSMHRGKRVDWVEYTKQYAKNKELIVEDAVNLLHEFLSETYRPLELDVNSYVDDATHFAVAVYK